MRIGMWTEALKLIGEKPLIGHGLLHFSEINNLPLGNPIQHFTHAHNQFLDIWMKLGIGGLAFLLAFLGLPIFVGWKLYSRNIDLGLGLSLIWLGGSFCVYGLSEVWLIHTNTIVILATYITTLLIVADKKWAGLDRPALI